jgi:hypothetical protein
MVSVSRRAGPPQRGQTACTKVGTFSSGLPPSPVKGASFGSSTGSWSSGTPTMPSFSQYTTGMGVPQYRCRLMSQSFSR